MYFDAQLTSVREKSILRAIDAGRHVYTEKPVAESVEQRNVDSDLQTILAQLPKQQRIAIALFYVDELSVAEVAAALKVSEGAVKSYLHQGRARLRSGRARKSSAPPAA